MRNFRINRRALSLSERCAPWRRRRSAARTGRAHRTWGVTSTLWTESPGSSTAVALDLEVEVMEIEPGRAGSEGI